MSSSRGKRSTRGQGTIRETSGGYQLRVFKDGRQVPYGTYQTYREVLEAQARWVLTGLLPEGDPEYLAQLTPATQAAMATDGKTNDELFEEWQQEKLARRRVAGDRLSAFKKTDTRRGGSPKTAQTQREHWAAWWSRPCKDHGRSKKPGCKKCGGPIGNLTPAQTTEAKLAAVLTKLDETRSKNTAADHLRVVKGYCSWLVDKGYLTENPLALWTTDINPATDRVRDVVVPDFAFIEILSDVFGTHLFREPSRRNKTGYVGVVEQKPRGNRKGGFLAYHRGKYLGMRSTPEEAFELVREAKGLNDGTTMDRLIFELLLGTGGRRSEVAGFRMSDILRHELLITSVVYEVEGSLQRQPTTKGHAGRKVVIGEDLRKMIDAECRRRGDCEPDAPLVTSPGGGLLDFKNWVRDRLIPALEIATERWRPLEVKRLMEEEGASQEEAEAEADAECARLMHLRPHHLRHTMAAMMIAAGATDAEIQITLGHKHINVTKTIYMHVLKSQARATAHKIEELRRSLREAA